ncbi:MAG TPA: urease subunit beta [Nitrospira sp.]|nr:urease subunit beta [Nitrospira sp.]
MKKKSGKAKAAPAKKGTSLASSIKTELARPIIPGQILFGAGDIEANAGRPTKELTVSNTGDRPIQVGSHCHFFEANRALKFDRAQAFGFRLSIPAGTAVRFEPGEEKRVTVVALAGKRVAHGINGLTEGSLDDAQVKAKALTRAAELGFSGKGGA